MLRRLRSLQEQCRSKTSLLERPFCNIGQTTSNGSVSGFQLNSVDAMSRASTPKETTISMLPAASCVEQDMLVQCNEDLTEKSAVKRTCSEVDDAGIMTNVDQEMSNSLSPARKRSRQDTTELIGSGNGAVATLVCSTLSHVLAGTEKVSGVVATSPMEKSIDSINVELSSSAVCETSNASVRRSGSFTQLTSFSRPTSVIRSANSSPRTWPSRRDLGQSSIVSDTFHRHFC